MSKPENLIVKLLKCPAVSLPATVIAGVGLGILFERQRAKKQLQTTAEPKTTIESNHGELPAEFVVSNKELAQIMLELTQLLGDRKSLEAIIPRAFTEEKELRNVCDNLEYTNNANDLHGLTKALSEPIWDLLDRGGKRWRPILGMFIAQAYGRSIDEVLEACSLVEIVHNGSLLIDDIEDQSQVRRDKPCVHLIYGADIAINAGCFMYYAPMLSLLKSYEKKFSKEKILRILRVYSEEMVNIHLGQGWDIYWHNCDKIAHIPTETQYLQMTAHKTGVLARMAARLTCEIIDLPEIVQKKFATFCEKIGVAFQIHDDILNIVGDEYVATKGYYGEDIFEGKMTLMVIHSLNNSSAEDQARLLDILKMKTKEQTLIDEAIAILKKNGSIDYARSKEEALIQEAWDGIKNYIPNNRYKGCLKALAEFFVARKV